MINPLAVICIKLVAEASMLFSIVTVSAVAVVENPPDGSKANLLTVLLCRTTF